MDGGDRRPGAGPGRRVLIVNPVAGLRESLPASWRDGVRTTFPTGSREGKGRARKRVREGGVGRGHAAFGRSPSHPKGRGRRESGHRRPGQRGQPAEIRSRPRHSRPRSRSAIPASFPRRAIGQEMRGQCRSYFLPSLLVVFPIRCSVVVASLLLSRVGTARPQSNSLEIRFSAVFVRPVASRARQCASVQENADHCERGHTKNFENRGFRAREATAHVPGRPWSLSEVLPHRQAGLPPKTMAGLRRRFRSGSSGPRFCATGSSDNARSAAQNRQ